MKKSILALFILLGTCLQTSAQTLAAQYNFSNNTLDATGNHPATLMNGATFTTDRFGNANSAILLDGVDDYLDITNAAGLQFDTYTFEAWVKPASLPVNSAQCILSVGGNGGDQFLTNIEAGADHGWNFSGYNNPSGTFDLVQGNTVTLNQWVHVVGVRDVGVARLYVNDILVDSSIINPGNTPKYGQNSAAIGRRTFNQFQYFHGSIDDISIYEGVYRPEVFSGNSVQLKANGNFLSVPDAASASLSNNMTIEGWIYFRCDNVNSTHIVTKGWCGSNWSYYLSVYDQKLRLGKWHAGLSGCAGNHSIFQSLDSLEYNTWTHFAVVINGLNVNFYLNGQDAGSILVSGTNGIGFHVSNQPIRFGNYVNISGVNTGTPKSNLDELRLWNTARSQVEIQQNMQNELIGNEIGLRGYWKMNAIGSGAGIVVPNSAVSTGATFNAATTGTAANIFFQADSAVPNGLPSCDAVLWLKADAGVVTTGNQVTQWNDQSTYANHVYQANAAQQPILQTNAINNKPVVRFNGNQLLQTNAVIDYGNTQKIDAYIVCKTNGADGMLLESSPDVNNNTGSYYVIDNYTFGSNGVASSIRGSAGGTRNFKNGTGFIPCYKLYRVSLDLSVQGSPAVQVKLNNVPLSDDAGYSVGTLAGNFTNHNLYIGNRSTLVTPLNGDIAEIIIYPTLQTAAKNAQISNYLNTKYFTGNGASYSALPANQQYSDAVYDDNTWKHSYNSANPTQLIASVKDNCLSLGARSDTVYLEPNAQAVGNAYYMRRHYYISTAQNPAGNKRVRLYYTNADFADLQAVTPGLVNHSQLCVTKYDGANEDGVFDHTGGNFTFIPSAAITTGSAYGQRYLEFDVNGFSEFWIHALSNVPLPAKNLHFDVVKCQTQNACIHWETTEEKNMSRYELQRSSDGQSFTTIFQQEAKQRSENNYAFEDKMLSGKVLYRLKMIDSDQTFVYSDTKVVDFAKLMDVHIFPNPAKDQFTLLGIEKSTQIQVYNMQGQLLQSSESSGNSIQIDVSQLISGIYQIRLTKDQYTQTERLVISR